MVRSSLKFLLRSTALFFCALGLLIPISAQSDAGDDRVQVEITTPQGVMVVELYNETPQHRDNFIKLAGEGFYDDLLFHRVMKNFMIQGGDPNSRDAKPGTALGTGGPGYTVPAEFEPQFVHTKGALCSARQPDRSNPQRASSGSQFYIVQGNPMTPNQLATFASRISQSTGKPFAYMPEQVAAYVELGGYPPLDTQYTVFGRVIKGLEVIDAIADQTVDSRNRPLEDLKMTVKVLK